MAKKAKMSELIADLKIFPQVLENVRVKDKTAAQSDPDVIEAVKKATEEIGASGRVLVRESGTEPLVRVMVEAETEDMCRKYTDSICSVIRAKGHAV